MTSTVRQAAASRGHRRQPAGGPTGRPRLLRPPARALTLFFTEMWERFSYYGLRPLLVLFMTAALADGGFGFERDAGVGDRRHLRGVASTSRRCPAAGSPTGWLGLRRAICTARC